MVADPGPVSWPVGVLCVGVLAVLVLRGLLR